MGNEKSNCNCNDNCNCNSNCKNSCNNNNCNSNNNCNCDYNNSIRSDQESVRESIFDGEQIRNKKSKLKTKVNKRTK